MNWIKTINKKIIRLQPATTNKQNKTKQKLWLDDDPFWLFLLGMRERNRTQTQITDCIQITFIFALAKKWAQFDWFIHFLWMLIVFQISGNHWFLIIYIYTGYNSMLAWKKFQAYANISGINNQTNDRRKDTTSTKFWIMSEKKNKFVLIP